MKKPKRRSYFSGLLPLFAAAHFAHHLLPALHVPLLPFIRSEFSLNYMHSALVHSAFTWAYGGGQIPSGWMADRFGRRIFMAIGICGVGLAGILVGISQTYIVLIVFFALMGVLGGSYHPSATPMISTLVEPNKRGRAFGIHEIGGAASFFLVPFVAASIAVAWGWRSSFIGLAIPVIIFGIIFYRIIGRWGAMGRLKSEVAEHHEGAAPKSGHLRRLVVFMILSVCGGGLASSVGAFLPLYMVDHFGASEQTAAAFISVYYSAGLWVSPLGGYISDRLGQIPVLAVNGLVSGAAIYLLNLTPYGLGIGALFLILGINTFVRLPVSEAYIIGQTTERNRSTVYGIYYFSMTETGAVFAPLLGLAIDRFGFYDSFTIVSVAIVVVVLACSAFLWRSRN